MHPWSIAARGVAVALFALGTAQPARAQTRPGATRTPATPLMIVEQFHEALATGDSAAAAVLLDTGAVILESGEVETRAEYLGSHLAADIAFARAIPAVRVVRRVADADGTAWVASTSRTAGQFEGRAIDSDGAELMVLRRLPSGWRIVAIHWSSHRHRP